MPPPPKSTFSEINRIFWRIVLFAIVAAAIVMMMGFVLKPVFPTGLPFGREGQTLFLLVVALALGIAHLVAAFWEKSGDWAILGLAPEGWQPRGLMLAVGGGLLLSLVAGGVLTILGMAGFASLPGGSVISFAGNALIVAGLATLAEGLAFRGYLFGLVDRRWGAWVAVAVSTVLFALVHTWSGAPSPVNIFAALALGFALGAIRARTGGLAAPWLAHAAFSWTQLGLLHSWVAGIEMEVPPEYALTLAEPAFLSGRGWGIEGGLIAGLLFVGIGFLLMRRVPLKPAPPARL
jgi:membrane protease YdiL (CAAX protease family)